MSTDNRSTQTADSCLHCGGDHPAQVCHLIDDDRPGTAKAEPQRVMDKFGGDVRAMAVEIVRLRDELAISRAFDPGDDSNA